MNERIKKIAKDAGVLGDWGEDALEGRFFIAGNTKQMEKFAELIVRECMDVAVNRNTDNEAGYVSVCREHAAKQIAEHFGVEE